MESMNGFRHIKSEDLDEINGVAHIFEHKCKTKLLWLENNDNEKAFSITFRTPPKDNTGVFHILEHSVLCGSKRFPVKEPFVNLLKSSMQTFLNAMTFPDKTMFPVASTNEKDLINLIDVYMDAVLNPNIYTKPEIFEQEGWHLENISDANETKLVYNGVVYNEMKGAFSDPESVLYNALCKALFPNSIYSFESGGTPEEIPLLTYEQFLEEHASHYQLSNSYIILYGNIDIDRITRFLDETYLHNYTSKSNYTPRTIKLQNPVSKNVSKEMVIPKQDERFALGYVIGTSHDRLKVLACSILLDAIAGSNEMPLKHTLLESKLCDDVVVYVAGDIYQPFAIIEAKGIKENCCEKFRDVFIKEIQNITDNGINKDLIRSSISHNEFLMREHDFGYSDGVVYAISAMSGWLYDDADAIEYIRYESYFNELKQKTNTNYFENLLNEIFIENTHAGSAQLISVESIKTKQDIYLGNLSNTIDSTELNDISNHALHLHEFQELPDTIDNLNRLPRLSIKDVTDAPREPKFEITRVNNCDYIKHEVNSKGIVYAYRYYDLSNINYDDLPYVTVMRILLGKLNTEYHTAQELDTLTQTNLGNLSFFTQIFTDSKNPDMYSLKLALCTSSIEENMEHQISIPNEIITSTIFEDKQKIKAILLQQKLAIEQEFINNGHRCATLRLSSYFTEQACIQDTLNGINYYLFLKKLLNDFDEDFDTLIKKLNELFRQIFCKSKQTISFTGSNKAYSSFCTTYDPKYASSTLKYDETNNTIQSMLEVPNPTIKNEAFIIPNDVVYVTKGFNQAKLQTNYFPFNGVWNVVSNILTLDYLWKNVRVIGGAYGTGFRAAKNGNTSFYSYRDPNLDETLKVFKESANWLRNYSPSKDDLDGYIISSVAEIDKPKKPKALLLEQDKMYFCKESYKDIKTNRNQILHTNIEQIRDCSQSIEQALNMNAMCVFGNNQIIDNSNSDLTVINLM